MSDERGGRYFREARFFLKGEKTVAQSHILEARKLLGGLRDNLALGGPAVQTRYTTLPDGTTIKATVMNGQYQAEIVSPTADVTEREVCEMYIESGPLEVGYFTTGDLSLVESSILHEIANPIEANLPGAVLTPDGAGTAIYKLPPQPEGEPPEPDPAECTMDIPDGGGGTFVDASCMECKQYVDQCDLTAKKLRADYFNPSRYTGKMRLFMQAILGSDPMRIGGFTYADQNKQIPNFVTSFLLDRQDDGDGNFTGINISFTTMLFCDANKNYWLVDAPLATGTTTTIRRMLFQPCADDILAELRSDEVISRDRLLQLETALFAYVDSATALEPSHTVTHDALLGSPIANGWHGAYGLFEAVRVAHQLYQPAPNAAYITAWYQRMVFGTAEYDAAAGEEPKPPTITIVTEETANWNGEYILDQILTPDYMNGVCSASTFEASGVVNGDAPIYAFYTIDDEIRLVRYVNTSHNSVGGSYVTVSACGITPGFTHSYGAYTGGNRGFYIVGYSNTIKAVKGTFTTDNTEYVFNVTWTWGTYGEFSNAPGSNAVPNNVWGGYCGDCNPAVSTTWKTFFGVDYWTVKTRIEYLDATMSWTSQRVNVTNGTIRVNSFVLIPLNCPDAAYVGSADVNDQYATVSNNTGAGGNPRGRVYNIVYGQAPASGYSVQPKTNVVDSLSAYTSTYLKQEEIITTWNINLATQTEVIVVGGGSETRTRNNGGGLTNLTEPGWPTYEWPAGLSSWADFLGMNGLGADLHGLRVEQSVDGLLRYQPAYDAAPVTNGDFPNTAHVFLGWA